MNQSAPKAKLKQDEPRFNSSLQEAIEPSGPDGVSTINLRLVCS
jgi:hypothetical protein